MIQAQKLGLSSSLLADARLQPSQARRSQMHCGGVIHWVPRGRVHSQLAGNYCMSRPRNSIAVSWKQAASYLPSLLHWLMLGAGDDPGIWGEEKKKTSPELLMTKISLWLGSSVCLHLKMILMLTNIYPNYTWLHCSAMIFFLVSSKWETRKIVCMP